MSNVAEKLATQNGAELDAVELREWLDSLDYVMQAGGPEKVERLLRQLRIHAQRDGVTLPYKANTPYINTVSVEQQPPFPGSTEVERRIKSLVRWNAMAMVVRANRLESGIGGHILRLSGDPLRSRVQSLFPGPQRESGRRYRLLPRTRFTWHLRTRVLGGAPAGRETRRFPQGTEARRWPFFLSPPLANARVLGVPYRLDGSWSHHGHLPSSFQPLLGRPRLEADQWIQGVGLLG